jgi:predicted nuclease of predicted toxin-antitoxin system
MRFLLDANMPRSTLTVLAEHGHTAKHVRDISMGDARDSEIAAQARADGAVLLTRDLDFADVRNYPPEAMPGILALRVPDDWTAGRITALVGGFLTMETLVARIPGHLVILDPSHARFRPALD